MIWCLFFPAGSRKVCAYFFTCWLVNRSLDMIVTVLYCVGFAIICDAVNRYCKRRLEEKEWTFTQSDFRDGREAGTRQGGRRVAIVTGANSGIGLALVEQLVACGLHVVLACRNVAKAQRAIDTVAERLAGKDHHGSMEILQVDVSSPASCLAAAAEVRKRHPKIGFLFCNAGVVQYGSQRLSLFLQLTSLDRIRTFFNLSRVTPEGPCFIEERPGVVTAEGYGTSFATHVLGHYVLVRQLEQALEAGNGCLVWTGSRGSSNQWIVKGEHLKDPMCVTGDEPYGYTKHLQDTLSVALNREWCARGRCVRSYVGCPGVVLTELPPPALLLLKPIVWAIAFVLPMWRISPQRGAAVLLHLASLKGTPTPAVRHQVREGDGRQAALDKKYVMEFAERVGAAEVGQGHWAATDDEQQWLVGYLEELLSQRGKGGAGAGSAAEGEEEEWKLL
ncbi:unnamed protein product [Vitrella brassicaformis CCMP3155]|uniref:Ketoreductase (KR) domain-containing protein n=1 Tax=Vitrella brassicaformis (strain CCMP3155) TaxID=1169540 RepID=A0A0G4FD44_VITBC|nr:unnamed protein product [Vitrella brassicaformis CCMP3155]|mmetsp:Transcript_19622/g.56254  ORF Transcript_19622/g.56254 Transcript_19622/m.56254 type:complete len:447 (-) Transcript_19622:420-1760(-)|eukprot:CEM10824.1 unnamed protein product [Vitrella brassicaformis CCMP3155]